MAPHSSILAWKIPRTEETSRLQSMGPQSQTRLSMQDFKEGYLLILGRPSNQVLMAYLETLQMGYAHDLENL